MEPAIRNQSMAGERHTVVTSRFLCAQLVRVAIVHVICLGMLVALGAVLTLGSVSVLVRDWNEHRAALVVTAMIALVTIPGLVQAMMERAHCWQER